MSDYVNATEPRWPFDRFGIECGKGWASLYEPILRYVHQAHTDTRHLWGHEPNDATPVIRQIKEKFGTLRIYVDGSNRFLDGMIHQAQSASGSMCECCGAPAMPESHHGWTSCLCPEHTRRHEEEGPVMFSEYRDRRKFSNTGELLDANPPTTDDTF